MMKKTPHLIALLILTALPMFMTTPATGAGGDSIKLTYGMDSRGNDYDVLSNTSLSQCKTKCLRDGKCVAFTYRARQKKCWLKDKFDDRIEHNYTITKYFSTKSSSGPRQEGNKNGYTATDREVVMGIKFSSWQSRRLSILNQHSRSGMDRRGSDYKTYQFGNMSEKFFPLCKQLCAVDNQCQSAAFRTDNGKCYLKKSSPRGSSDPNVMSASVNPGNKA